MTENINKIYNIDCLRGMQLLPDNYIDLTVTSPPYGNLRDYQGYDFNFNLIAYELYRITKLGCVLVWIVNDQMIDGSESLISFKQAIFFVEKCGYLLHDMMIWEKPGFSNPSHNRYHQIFEYMFIYSKNKPKTFNPIKDKLNKSRNMYGSVGITTQRQKNGSMKEKKRKLSKPFGMRSNIWKMKTSAQENMCKPIKHPATFSKQLIKDQIKSWSNKNDLVLDCFAGSGTTLVEAKKLGRNYLGYEISKKYYNLCKDNLQVNYLF